MLPCIQNSVCVSVLLAVELHCFVCAECQLLCALCLQLGPLLKAEQSLGTPSMHRGGAMGSLKSSDSLGGIRGSGGASQQVDGRFYDCMVGKKAESSAYILL